MDVAYGLTIEDALQRVGLEKEIDKKVYKLSGGEQQRVALARVLMKKCKLILADEPTGSLDGKTTDNILDVFDEVHKIGKTIILITHDQKVANHCKRILTIEDGKLHE